MVAKANPVAEALSQLQAPKQVLKLEQGWSDSDDLAPLLDPVEEAVDNTNNEPVRDSALGNSDVSGTIRHGGDARNNEEAEADTSTGTLALATPQQRQRFHDSSNSPETAETRHGEDSVFNGEEDVLQGGYFEEAYNADQYG